MKLKLESGDVANLNSENRVFQRQRPQVSRKMQKISCQFVTAAPLRVSAAGCRVNSFRTINFAPMEQ